MNIYTSTFATRDVLLAADISNGKLQNWFARDVVLGHRNVEGGGSPGRHRRFSWFNVMEIANAAALVNAGLDLSLAFRAAQVFAHMGAGPLPGIPERFPSMPFKTEHGRTLMFVAGDRVHIAPYEPGSDALAAARVHLGQPEAFIVLDLLGLFNRVCASLELDPQAVMDEAYSEGAK